MVMFARSMMEEFKDDQLPNHGHHGQELVLTVKTPIISTSSRTGTARVS